MFTITLIPLWIVFTAWHGQKRACQRTRALCSDLVAWKQTLRTSGAAGRCSYAALESLLREGVHRGFRCAGSLAEGIESLRGLYVRAEKVNRLRLIWMGRLMIVVCLSAAVRCYLLGVGPALLVRGAADGFLVLSGSIVLIASSILFFRIVPALGADEHGVAGFNEWLWHRMIADNGSCESSVAELVRIEREEQAKGISLRDEKLAFLTEQWRSRIVSDEQRAEAAAELLPVFEFVGFGLFLALVLLPAFVQKL